MSRSGLSAVLLQRIAVLAGELAERCAKDRLLFNTTMDPYVINPVR